jgi:hypothetical protein
MLASDPDNANSIVIAHSHGGNVAFRAISKLDSRGARIHLITLATPFLQVFPTWSGPGFWLLFIVFAAPIFQLILSLRLLPEIIFTLFEEPIDFLVAEVLAVFAGVPVPLFRVDRVHRALRPRLALGGRAVAV